MATKYYCAPDAKVYINGIFIEEIYDIQYQYRELKEPIYGYLSKEYDHVVRGTTIVTGAFTLNYTHDQYLPAILWKASSPAQQKIVNPTLDFKTKKDRYQAALREFKIAIDLKDQVQAFIKDGISLGNQGTNANAGQAAKNAQLTDSKKAAQVSATSDIENYLKNLSTDADRAACIEAAAKFENLRTILADKIKGIQTDIAEQIKRLNEEITRLSVLIDLSTKTVPNSQEESRLISVMINDLIAQKQATYDLIRGVENDLQPLIDKAQQDYITAGEAIIATNTNIDTYLNLIDTHSNATSDVTTTKQFIKAGGNDIQATKDLKNSAIPSFVQSVLANNDLTKYLQTAYPESFVLIQKIEKTNGPATENDAQKLYTMFNQPEFRDAVVRYADQKKELAKKAKQELGLDPVQDAIKNDDYFPDRAENHEDFGPDISFNITIEYNGVPHVKIVDAHFVSHNTGISQSGQGIKANFVFIAKSLSNEFGTTNFSRDKTTGEAPIMTVVQNTFGPRTQQEPLPLPTPTITQSQMLLPAPLSINPSYGLA
jgi:hypothetical protein